MFIFLFMTDLFITNTIDRPCIRPPYISPPPPPSPSKTLTKEYKPRAYSQRFTVLYITYFNNKGIIGIPIKILLLPASSFRDRELL
jgi:hypothetical protein